jgi:hypothetical protein
MGVLQVAQRLEREVSPVAQRLEQEVSPVTQLRSEG